MIIRYCDCSHRNGILGSSLEKNISLIEEKLRQSNKKWASSSILLQLQRFHNLSLCGILLYLPVSILSLWLLILSFTNVFLVMNSVWKTRDYYIFQINGGANQILLHGGVFSSSEVLGKTTSIQSKLLTPKLAGLKRKERKVWSKPALHFKRLR